MTRAALLLALLAACGGRQTPDGDDDAILIVRADVGDAVLWVDGRYVAPIDAIARAGVRLEPGAQRVEVRHDDHFSHYAELELTARERRVLEVDLAPILP